MLDEKDDNLINTASIVAHYQFRAIYGYMVIGKDEKFNGQAECSCVSSMVKRDTSILSFVCQTPHVPETLATR
jgi:hypothetical protein